jgi:hypothetical protein
MAARRKTSKPKSKPYTGELREPIPFLLDKSALQIGPAILKKLEALCRHYDIPNKPEKWFFLALALAETHVPGFRVDHQTPQWCPTAKTTEDLLLYVELYQAEEAGKSVRRAAEHLVNRPGYFHGRNAENLRQRYSRLLKNADTPEGSRLRVLIALLSGGR